MTTLLAINKVTLRVICPELQELLIQYGGQ